MSDTQTRPLPARLRRPPIGLIRLAVAVVLIAAIAIAAGFARTQRGNPIDHVYLIVLENKGYSQIVGNAKEAPYINSLIAGYGLATNYNAVAHPSQPDYFSMVSGATLVNDDFNHDVTAPSVFDQLEQANLTWHVYAQNLPEPCWTGAYFEATTIDLIGPAGEYARHHNPAISFTAIRNDPKRCAKITSLQSFDPQAANFEMIIPNNTNNMHTGTIQQGDAFLKQFVPRITSSPAFRNGILLITWDEGVTNDGGGGKVPLIAIRTGMKPGMQSPAAHTHRGLLRTIEDAFDLPCLAGACNAAPMNEFLGS